MKIELKERTARHVLTYFERTRDEYIQRMCPQSARTPDEALRDYFLSKRPDADSFGRTVYLDGQYAGDVWCYCIHASDDPDAMISYCLFDKRAWGQGAATGAVRMFLKEAAERYGLRTVGAFTRLDNLASVRVLEKNGFVLQDFLVEEGAPSGYYQLTLEETV